LQKKGIAIYRLALKQETAESGGRYDSLATCPQGTTGPDSQGERTSTTLTNACSQSSILSDGIWYCITAQVNCPTDSGPDPTGICVTTPTCYTPPTLPGGGSDVKCCPAIKPNCRSKQRDGSMPDGDIHKVSDAFLKAKDIDVLR
jgi:hypothetical protein